MSSILYLIRHGKTEYNEKKCYCGFSNPNLSESGAKDLRNILKEKRYPLCKKNYTTGLKRTNETFNIIYENKEYEILEGFKEYNFGDFEGKTYEELKDNLDYINWILDKDKSIPIKNGESKLDFYKRLEEALIDIVKREEEALIICHGGVIGTLLELFSKEEKSFYELQPSYGEGYKIKVDIEDSIKIEILEVI